MKERKRTKTSQTSRSKINPQDFLLEIGCEELPADYMPVVLDWESKGPGLAGGLASAAKSVLDKTGLVWKKLQSFATPRRLVLRVSDVVPKVRETVEGPPVSIAFDASGNPTDVAKGFAKKQGVSLAQLNKRQTTRGGRLVLEQSVPAEEVLAKSIPSILQRIVFPKMMRWDNSGIRFARPIRWVLALYGPKIVSCQVGFLKSDRSTYGLRRNSVKAVRIASSETYFSKLQRLHVKFERGLIWKKVGNPLFEEVSHCKAEKIRKELEKSAKRLRGQLPDQATEEFAWLLTTVTFLAENPVVKVGSFQKDYLNLPAEVLATSMAKHLKLFSVYESGGTSGEASSSRSRTPDGRKLLPKFLAVLEGKPAKPQRVMANIERILEARFSDARFFYQEDRKTPLGAKVPQLKNVVFHEKLGSVADRIPRLKRLMNCVAEQIHVPADLLAGLEQVAELCKADLVTQMVREFPSLQGLIGSHYAAQDGQLGLISQAIGEQYKPRTASDSLPKSPLGALVGLVDRVDLLIGYFGVGLKPSGSVDPYGLRRQALGVVRILTAFKDMPTQETLFFQGLSIDRLLDEGIQSWDSRLTVDPKRLKKELRAFLRERFEWLAFVDHRIARELIVAVLEATDDDLAGAWKRLLILQEFWTDPKKKVSLVKAAKVAERTGRIVRSVKSEDDLEKFNPDILKELSEKKLWELWNEVAPVIKEQVKRRQYPRVIETYGSLYPAVHQFFQTVFVMDEDPDLRRNRLAFMNQIYQALAGGFADLSKLPLAGIEPS